MTVHKETELITFDWMNKFVPTPHFKPQVTEFKLENCNIRHISSNEVN